MITRLKPGKLVWRLLGLIVSISIALILLSQVDLNSFTSMVSSVPAWSLAGALLSYLLLNFFRLIRFRTLLQRHDIPIDIFYPIVLYHNFLVRVLPLKTGEISYVVLLRQYFNQPLREGVSSLVSSRLFELFMVIIVGGGALLLAAEQLNVQPTVALLIVVVGAVVYLGGLYFSGSILHMVAKFMRRFGSALGQERLAGWGDERINALAATFDRVRQPRIFLPTLFVSIFTYSMSQAFYLILLYAIGVRINFGLLVGIVSIVMLAESIPLATISGLGMIEGGWTFGLVTLAGFDVGQAASIGFFLHACQIISAVVTGLLGYLWLQTVKRQETAAHLGPEGSDARQG